MLLGWNLRGGVLIFERWEKIEGRDNIQLRAYNKVSKGLGRGTYMRALN